MYEFCTRRWIDAKYEVAAWCVRGRRVERGWGGENEDESDVVVEVVRGSSRWREET